MEASPCRTTPKKACASWPRPNPPKIKTRHSSSGEATSKLASRMRSQYQAGVVCPVKVVYPTKRSLALDFRTHRQKNSTPQHAKVSQYTIPSLRNRSVRNVKTVRVFIRNANGSYISGQGGIPHHLAPRTSMASRHTRRSSKRPLPFLLQNIAHIEQKICPLCVVYPHYSSRFYDLVAREGREIPGLHNLAPVSYTHLTLPTIYSV